MGGGGLLITTIVLLDVGGGANHDYCSAGCGGGGAGGLLITTIVLLDVGGGGGGLLTLKPVKLTIYHMQPFRASVLIQE